MVAGNSGNGIHWRDRAGNISASGRVRFAECSKPVVNAYRVLGSILANAVVFPPDFQMISTFYTTLDFKVQKRRKPHLVNQRSNSLLFAVTLCRTGSALKLRKAKAFPSV